MTIGEAIKALSLMEHVESIAAAYGPGERREDTAVRELKEACRMASEALRTQQTHIKLDRSRWEGCEFCLSERQDQGPCVCACSSFNISNKQYATRFCPACGKPLIEEAWAELERRIGGES